MLLEVRDISVAYGVSPVLFGVSLSVDRGEVATLIGRNGMGKTTTVSTIMGILRPHEGEIKFREERIEGKPPYVIAGHGVSLVPEGRRIFPNLSVRENLLMAYRERGKRADSWTFDRVMSVFPRLTERLSNGGSRLSGGEQQMLAIGRALMTNPSLLILDEATEGLAPNMRHEIWRQLMELKKTGLSMLVIDKDIDALSELADRHYVLEKGVIVWSGHSDQLVADQELQNSFLGV